MKTVDFVDDDGWPRRVELPEGAIEPEHGFPISADWEALEIPKDLGQKLASELVRRGLVTPRDYHKPGAIREIQGALQSVLKLDAQRIQAVLSGTIQVTQELLLNGRK